MHAKTYLQQVVKGLNGFVYIVGVFAICQFVDDRWPGTSFAIFVSAVAAVVVWFLWTFLFRPFFSALKGEASKSGPLR